MKLKLETRALCGRVAYEQHRLSVNKRALELRNQCQAMLEQGKPAMLVDAHLTAMLGDALKSQAARQTP